MNCRKIETGTLRLEDLSVPEHATNVGTKLAQQNADLFHTKETALNAKIYGTAPLDLGKIDISPAEMMFWLYCPIKMPGSTEIVMPSNLQQFFPIVEACMEECDSATWRERYVYLTAKTLWVTHENPGQRRGWHCDGFMTDDLNYIWYDSEPTVFCVPEVRMSFTQEHKAALEEMDEAANWGPNITYPLKHLLRLDQTVLHRVGDFGAPGMRSFVKLSVSRHPFNLVGNSVNHALAPDWSYAHRLAERNPEVARVNDHAEIAA